MNLETLASMSQKKRVGAAAIVVVMGLMAARVLVFRPPPVHPMSGALVNLAAAHSLEQNASAINAVERSLLNAPGSTRPAARPATLERLVQVDRAAIATIQRALRLPAGAAPDRWQHNQRLASQDQRDLGRLLIVAAHAAKSTATSVQLDLDCIQLGSLLMQVDGVSSFLTGIDVRSMGAGDLESRLSRLSATTASAAASRLAAILDSAAGFEQVIQDRQDAYQIDLLGQLRVPALQPVFIETLQEIAASHFAGPASAPPKGISSNSRADFHSDLAVEAILNDHGGVRVIYRTMQARLTRLQSSLTAVSVGAAPSPTTDSG